MNTYSKFAPNVYLAKCTEQHEKGEVIAVTTKYGKENESIVFNFMGKKDDFFYYSIIRADGFNSQVRAENRAEKLGGYAATAEKKSDQYWQASKEGKDFLSLGEPIKIGHHSEKRHRALIERNHDRMNKAVEYSRKAQTYEDRISYWQERTEKIDLSMPESVDFFAFEVEKCKKIHEGYLSGEIERSHSFSLTYAKKDLNNAEKNYKLALKLWGEKEN